MENKLKILIAGGSGFIGQKLAKKLADNNYTIRILSRNPVADQKYEQYKWDIENGFVDQKSIEDVDYVINLAGTGIADGRWTAKQKIKIEESRINATALLYRAIDSLKSKPKAYISASAIGYYGTSSENLLFNEDSDNGNDFLARVCKNWETEALKFENIGIRTCVLRTGVVFDKKQGAFPKLTQSLRFGFVSGVGSGKQYIPWIYIDDLVDLYLFAIENENMRGIFNAVAPDMITQNDLLKEISSISGKRTLPNLPSIILNIIYGEMSGILLKGNRISSEKVIENGFIFKYPNIQKALYILLNSKK